MIHYFGITGPIGHGKTTFAQFLVDAFGQHCQEACIRSFATPVKEIAQEQFGWDGKKDERGRRLLQVIGTDAGRHYSPDIWVRKWSTAGGHYDGVVIADDVRFENESAFIRDCGGKIIHICRELPIEVGHESENSISLREDDLALNLPDSLPETQQIAEDLVALIVKGN